MIVLSVYHIRNIIYLSILNLTIVNVTVNDCNIAHNLNKFHGQLPFSWKTFCLMFLWPNFKMINNITNPIFNSIKDTTFRWNGQSVKKIFYQTFFSVVEHLNNKSRCDNYCCYFLIRIILWDFYWAVCIKVDCFSNLLTHNICCKIRSPIVHRIV